ncbi:MAG TPA: hypothetical protein VG106_14875, partial [Vicinamibacterales bacterium]|nr:hypothetical protein [Vicinamibacterales bacterium]
TTVRRIMSGGADVQLALERRFWAALERLDLVPRGDLGTKLGTKFSVAFGTGLDGHTIGAPAWLGPGRSHAFPAHSSQTPPRPPDQRPGCLAVERPGKARRIPAGTVVIV